MYITYDINTRRIKRIDTERMILKDNNLKMVERDISLDNDLCINMCVYKVDNNEEFYIDDELVAERENNILRAKREPLLKAFDIYKSNIIVGAISLSEEDKQAVIDWYNLILALNEAAINSPPDIIQRYINA